ncbi:hypothetical protein ACFL2V_09365 [Pseudomonadota bacterium]
MYSKGILTRYADTIKNSEQREALKREIDAIQYEEFGLCVGIEGRRAFVRAGIEHLYGDFFCRLAEFVMEEPIIHTTKLETQRLSSEQVLLVRAFIRVSAGNAVRVESSTNEEHTVFFIRSTDHQLVYEVVTEIVDGQWQDSPKTMAKVNALLQKWQTQN